MTYCLVPMTVEQTQQILGKNFVARFQQEMDAVLQPLKKYLDQGRPLSLGKELWEYAVADSIEGAEWCGAGKSIIDVQVGEDIGLDVKSVQMGPRSTTEASMYQYLQVERVAEYFQTQDKLSLWQMFVDGWLTKTRTIKNYYLLVIFRNKDTLECSIAGFLVQDTPVGYLAESCKFNRESMQVTSIADPALVDIKIYKGKTRMELRIKHTVFNDSKYCLPIYRRNS